MYTYISICIYVFIYVNISLAGGRACAPQVLLSSSPGSVPKEHL